MARDGTSSILEASRTICRMVGIFGLARFTANTSPQFGAAVAALVGACQLFESFDDQPGQIDETAPFGPEDETPPEG